MIPVLVSGLVAGALLAFGSFFSRGPLASPAFGALPMLLTALPALAALLLPSDMANPALRGTALRGTALRGAAIGRTALGGFGLRGRFSRRGAAIAAGIAPALMHIAYIATQQAAFIAQEPGIGSGLALTAWYALFITLPLVMLLRAERASLPEWSARHAAAFLLALAAGLCLMGMMTSSIDLRPAYAAYALLSLVPLLHSMLRPAQQSRDTDERTDATTSGHEAPSHARMEAMPPAAAHAGRTAARRASASKSVPSKGRRSARTGPFWQGTPHASARVIAAWIAQILPAVLVPMVLAMLRMQTERGLQPVDAAVLIAPLIAVLAASAMFAAHLRASRAQDASRLWLMFGALCVLTWIAAVRGGGWRSQYTAWAENGTASSGMAMLQIVTVLAALLPALLLITQTLDVRGARLRMAASTAAGMLGALFAVPLVPPEIWLAAVIVPTAIAAAFVLDAWSVKPQYAVLGALLLAVPAVYPLTESVPHYRHFIVPARFREIDALEMPGGRISLQLARDYDDPFTLLAWNDVTPLTSNPALVNDALQMYGHLPMLLSGGGRDASVLVLGSGSGTVLGAVALHRPASVDCVEPVPGVVALRDSLARARFQRPPSKGVTWHAERIPAFLARSSGRWDVIISPEPFATPFVSTEIVTSAHFARVAAHLSPRGVFAQWLPVAAMQPGAVRAVIAAFLEAFPHADAWLANADGDNAMLCLMGYARNGAMVDEGRTAFETLMADKSAAFRLRTIGLWTWADVISRHVMTREALVRLASDAAPFTRFSPASLLHADAASQGGAAFVRRILDARSLPSGYTASLPDSLRAHAGAALAARPTVLQAAVLFSRGDDTSAAKALMPLVSSVERSGEARRLLAMSLARRAAAFVNARQDGQAIHLLNDCMRIQPVSTLVLRLLMIASLRTGDKAAADMAIGGIKLLDPLHAGFRDNEATIKAETGAPDDALLLYENAITIDPTNEDFYCNMAALQFRARHGWEAVRILDNAAERAWYPAKAYYLQGMVYAQYGRRSYALKAFEKFEATAMPDDALWSTVESAKAEILKGGAKTP